MADKKMCELPATVRRFWPGKPMDHVCIAHALDSVRIMLAMGHRLELRLEGVCEEHPCACTEGFSQTIYTGGGEGE
jgi:hypothetical protein